ncbi:TPA: hypothetical protein ACWKRR_000620 [Escherichia coli]
MRIKTTPAVTFTSSGMVSCRASLVFSRLSASKTQVESRESPILL